MYADIQTRVKKKKKKKKKLAFWFLWEVEKNTAVQNSPYHLTDWHHCDSRWGLPRSPQYLSEDFLPGIIEEALQLLATSPHTSSVIHAANTLTPPQLP